MVVIRLTTPISLAAIHSEPNKEGSQECRCAIWADRADEAMTGTLGSGAVELRWADRQSRKRLFLPWAVVTRPMSFCLMFYTVYVRCWTRIPETTQQSPSTGENSTHVLFFGLVTKINIKQRSALWKQNVWIPTVSFHDVCGLPQRKLFYNLASEE